MKVKEAVAAYRVPRKIYTYQDYSKLPEDGNRYEIIQGELIMSPAPYIIHQEVSVNIVIEMVNFVQKYKVGKFYYAPTDVVLSDTNVMQPDILFILNEHLDIVTEKNIKGVPDLIIEIISPSTGYYDLRSKKDIYEKFGVREYWIVDPLKQRVDIYNNVRNKFESHQRFEKTGILKSNVVAGLQIKLETIFNLE